jgi:hypothetical protein
VLTKPALRRRTRPCRRGAGLGVPARECSTRAESRLATRSPSTRTDTLDTRWPHRIRGGIRVTYSDALQLVLVEFPGLPPNVHVGLPSAGVRERRTSEKISLRVKIESASDGCELVDSTAVAYAQLNAHSDAIAHVLCCPCRIIRGVSPLFTRPRRSCMFYVWGHSCRELPCEHRSLGHRGHDGRGGSTSGKPGRRCKLSGSWPPR